MELLSRRECRIVKFLIHILVGKAVIAYFLSQVASEWLYYGEYHLARRSYNCIALDKVETPIRIILAIGIDIIKIHYLNERLAINGSGRNIIDFSACSIT